MCVYIREAAEQDYPALISLWNNELGNNYEIESFTRRMARLNENSAYKTYVAISHGEVVGFVTTVRVLTVHTDEGYIKINGLAVASEHHGKGFGRALMEHIEARAAEDGIYYMLLCSGFQRTGAHEFYKRLGYSCDSYCITKSLSKG